MEFIQIEVAQREVLGSQGTRRLRRQGMVPAVLYGLDRPNLNLAIRSEELQRFLKTHSHLVELRLGDKTRPAILREMQYDPLTDAITHVDFNRVDQDHEVTDQVPVRWKGRARGEGEGGVFQALHETIEVRCRPRLLPQEFVLDVNDLGVGDSIRAGQVAMPEGVTLVMAPGEMVAHVALPKHAPAAAAEGGAALEGAAEASVEGAPSGTE